MFLSLSKNVHICKIPIPFQCIPKDTKPFSIKVYFTSQILEHPSIGEYWNISGVPVLPVNVIFTFFGTCWWNPETNNTGTGKWSSIVQYACTSIWDLKYTFSFFFWRVVGNRGKTKKNQRFVSCPPRVFDFHCAFFEFYFNFLFSFSKNWGKNHKKFTFLSGMLIHY